MSRIIWVALVLGCLLPQTATHAATIAVKGDNPQQSITVTIENASVDRVLEDLGKKYGFEVAGLKHAKRGENLSATMSGSLQSILERLLRNWNHLIVRSVDSETGIAKVMILNSVYGAVSSRAEQDSQKTGDEKALLQAFGAN